MRSLVPNEKKSRVLGDPVGDEARPRQLDHRPDRVVLALADALLVADPHHELAQDLELLLVVDERDHDLDVRRVAGALLDRRGRAHDRLDLHLVDLGHQDPEPAAAGAEHRVLLVDLLHARERLLELLEVVGALDPRALDLRAQVRQVLEELVQRRVEQPDRHRQARHRLEQALEVLLLERQQLRQRGAPGVLVVGHDHRPHLGLAVLGHEHVLRAAEADALGAELARLAGVLGRVGVRAHAEPADLVGPLEHRVEVLARLGLHERDVLERHAALRAVDRDPVALGDRRVADADLLGLEVDRQRRRPRPRPGGPCRAPRAPRARPCRPRR